MNSLNIGGKKPTRERKQARLKLCDAKKITEVMTTQFPRCCFEGLQFIITPVGLRIESNSLLQSLDTHAYKQIEGYEFTHCPWGLLPRDVESFLKKIRPNKDYGLKDKTQQSLIERLKGGLEL